MGTSSSAYLATSANSPQAQAPYFANDLDVLNYALTLEHLEAYFYTQVVAGGHLQGDALSYLTVIRDHEVAHVAALVKGIQDAGGTPVKPRQSYDFSSLGDMNTQAGILQIAGVLEPTGVAAYDGAAREISNKAYLIVAGQIVQIEARHAAIIRTLVSPNTTPVPNPFEGLKRPNEILAAVGPLLGPEQP